MFVVLKRVDPEEDIDRWYSVTVQATLFSPVAVVCAWGNRQTAWQRMRIIPAVDTAAAESLARRIVKQKQKRGYVLVHEAANQ